MVDRIAPEARGSGLWVDFNQEEGTWVASITLEGRKLLKPHVMVRLQPDTTEKFFVEISHGVGMPIHKTWQVEGTLEGAFNFAIGLMRNYLFGTPVRTA